MSDLFFVWFVRIEAFLVLIVAALLYTPSRHLIVRFLMACSLNSNPLFIAHRRALWRSVYSGKFYDDTLITKETDAAFWRALTGGFKR